MMNVNAALAALSDPTRRRVFERVAEAPASVAEITRAADEARGERLAGA